MLNAETVRELIHYEPETGKFYFRARNRKWFENHAKWKAWNKAYAGREIFKTDTGKGYLQGAILGKNYRAHRVAWLIQTGGMAH